VDTRLSRVVPAALKKSSWSFVPASVIRTRTAWLEPVQPVRTDAGAIGSDHVSRIQSPDSIRPLVSALPVCTSVPYGGLSIVIELDELVVFTPALFSTTMRMLYVPSGTAALSPEHVYGAVVSRQNSYHWPM
jgi:hypothetical protein